MAQKTQKHATEIAFLLHRIVSVNHQLPSVLCVCERDIEIEQGLTSQQTHYRSYWAQVFTGQMSQSSVSKH